MPKESSLSKSLKPNYARLRVSVHKKRHSKEIALSYTDIFKVTHRTPFCRRHKDAEAVLRGFVTRTLGIARVTFVVTEETLETKSESAISA